MNKTRLKGVLSLLATIAALLTAALLIAGMTQASAPADRLCEVVAVAETGDVQEVQDAQTSAETQESDTGWKAIAAGIAIGLAAAAGAVGMGIAIAKTNESIARQPEADGKLRSTFMLGLIFIETAIIYALVVAILIIFVL